MSQFFVHPTSHSHQHHGRRLVRKTRHRHEHPLMFHIDMRMKPRRMDKGISNRSERPSYSTVTADMLKYHNYYRARHCVQPLTIDDRLNKIAQSYAEYLASTKTFEHSGNKMGNEPIGENLYKKWISFGEVDINTKEAAKGWYEEISMHDFTRPKFSKETGHFTQMVWKDTRLMGVGVALSADKREVYYVTNYYPPGNIVGRGTFEKNVLQPRCK